MQVDKIRVACEAGALEQIGTCDFVARRGGPRKIAAPHRLAGALDDERTRLGRTDDDAVDVGLRIEQDGRHRVGELPGLAGDLAVSPASVARDLRNAYRLDHFARGKRCLEGADDE